MKEYDRCVVWLDYFDSSLKRSQGRRVPLSAATRDPKLDELFEACARLNFRPERQQARHPRSSSRESGYVAVVKTGPKRGLLMKVARELALVRGSGSKKPQPHVQARRK